MRTGNWLKYSNICISSEAVFTQYSKCVNNHFKLYFVCFSCVTSSYEIQKCLIPFGEFSRIWTIVNCRKFKENADRVTVYIHHLKLKWGKAAEFILLFCFYLLNAWKDIIWWTNLNPRIHETSNKCTNLGIYHDLLRTITIMHDIRYNLVKCTF